MKPLSTLIKSLQTGQADEVIEATWWEFVLYALAAVLALSAYAACLGGLWLYLVPAYGAISASFIVAAVTLLTAIVLVIIARMVEQAVQKRIRHKRQSMLMQTAMSMVPQLLSSRSPVSLLVAGGLAYLAAESWQNKDRSRKRLAGDR